MLPSRPRLERWNPDSLTHTGQAVKDGGKAIDHAVVTINADIKTMPETKAWSGDAHSAATSMFGRGEDQTGAFADYTSVLGAVLQEGAGRIGSARSALLDKADEIDLTGQLHVSDQWVVLIKGASLTIEETAALERRAQAEQVAVNTLLLKVGGADDDTAAELAAAAKPHGFVGPDATSPVHLLPGMQRPSDEVPNPALTTGLMQQAMLRDTDMAQTIREIKTEIRYDPETGEEIATVTTFFMQDGSRHERRVNAIAAFSDREPSIVETHFDKDGNPVSETRSTQYTEWATGSLAGAKVTTVRMADRTTVTMIERPGGGSPSVTVHTPDGRPADVPLNLLNHPILSSTSAGLSGVSEQAARGIPFLTDDISENVRVGAKYGGPGVSVATALWDFAVADSGFERCVAGAEGVASVTAGTVAGFGTSGMGPWVAIPVALVASGGGQALGNWIGNTFCPR